MTVKTADLEGKSLYLFPSDNCFRRILFKIVTNKAFDYIVISVIILSAI